MKKVTAVLAIVAGAAAALTGSVLPAAANIVTYNFNVDGCSSGGCGLTNYGKVTVTDLLGGGVSVAFDLTSSGSGFIDTGALNFDTVYFNLAAVPPAGHTSGMPALFTSASGSFVANGGFGTYNYKIDCNTACASNNPYYSPWSIIFDSGSGLTTSSFILGAGTTKNTYFVADISNPNGGTPLTGRIGATIGTTVTKVPEPLTLSLFGAGLAGAAVLRRRKKAA